MYLVIEEENPITITGMNQVVSWGNGGFEDTTTFHFPVSVFTQDTVEVLKKYFSGINTDEQYTFSIYETDDVMKFTFQSSGFLQLEFNLLEDRDRPAEMYFVGTIRGVCPYTDEQAADVAVSEE